MTKIKISTDYTRTPGGRYIREGKYSGEDFRRTLLGPKYREAVEHREKLVVDLDGGYGYPPSFLEEAFGGLARELNDRTIAKNIEIISDEEPALVGKIDQYIQNAFR